MKDYFDTKINVANITTLVKVGILGILSAEAYYFSQIVSIAINPFIKITANENVVLILSVLSLLIVGLYLFVRGFHLDILKIFKSGRWDILIAFVSGIIFDSSFGGFGTGLYLKFVSLFTLEQLILFIAAPIIFGAILVIRAIQIKLAQARKKDLPFFINDAEKKSLDEDLLGFAEEAKRFSERVFNQGSANSMVFGIDAPWGIGKSSFVNFCKEYWEKDYDKQAIVYSFNPLRYEGRTNLLEKFVDGLIRTIQKILLYLRFSH